METIQQQTDDGYVQACTFQPDIDTSSIVFDVGNQPVLMQLYRLTDRSFAGQPAKYVLDTIEIPVVPSLGNTITGAAGARWRSAVPGKSAVLIARRFLRADPSYLPGVGYDGTVSTSGGLTPPSGGGSLTIIVQSNGATVGTEGTVNFVDGAAASAAGVPQVTWNVVDDAANSRVNITPVVVTLSRVLSYVEFTSPVTISAISEGTANTIVSAGAVTVDGATPVKVEAWAEWIGTTANFDVTLYLFDGSTSLGLIGEYISSSASTDRRAVYVQRRFTPSAGSHTFSWRGSRGASNVTVNAGAGGAGTPMPGWIRVSYDV